MWGGEGWVRGEWQVVYVLGLGGGGLSGVSPGGRVSSVVEVGAFGSFGVAGMGIGWSWAVCVH